MGKRAKRILAVCLSAALFFGGGIGALYAHYPRPYPEEVAESGIEPALAYAVMKAESGFSATCVSPVGAVGIMQLMPATAQFIAEKCNIPFEAERLTDGSYNVMLGCRYLAYLLKKFPNVTAAVCAYNAGETNVSAWLKDIGISPDGKTLRSIPFAETAAYEKKVGKFLKFYRFLYH